MFGEDEIINETEFITDEIQFITANSDVPDKAKGKHIAEFKLIYGKNTSPRNCTGRARTSLLTRGRREPMPSSRS